MFNIPWIHIGLKEIILILYGSFKYTIFIKVWLNYNSEVTLIWYNCCIKQTLITDKLLLSNN